MGPRSQQDDGVCDNSQNFAGTNHCHPAACFCTTTPRGTYLPYFLTFFLNDLFLLNAPSIGSPASMAALIASARIACSGKYSDVTFPVLPARPVLPTCAAQTAFRRCRS